jgi:hypothetical protein
VFCSQRCRQGAHRAKVTVTRAHATAGPLRLAYADPPYPGSSFRYYRDHPDYAGEVDLEELLSRLAGYDGWALSTSARALPDVLSRCVARGLPVRVAAWFRGPRPHKTARLVNAWEPVIFVDARRVAHPDGATDALAGVVSRRRSTLPTWVIGAKPPEFCRWLFELLGATAEDELDDLYPGSGLVARTWEWYQGRDPSRAAAADASAQDLRDASVVQLETTETSCGDPGDDLSRPAAVTA